MTQGSGWEASPWLLPAAIVGAIVLLVLIFGYLAGRELLFPERDDRPDDDELRAAQKYLNLLDDPRGESPREAWAAFWAAEQRQAAAYQRAGINDPDPDPDPTTVLPDYVIEALNGHTSASDCADSIFTRHGLQ